MLLTRLIGLKGRASMDSMKKVVIHLDEEVPSIKVEGEEATVWIRIAGITRADGTVFETSESSRLWLVEKLQTKEPENELILS